MDQAIEQGLKYLRLHNLRQHWDEYLKNAAAQSISYHNLLSSIITDEYQNVLEKRRAAQIKVAAIPQVLVMETFPFQRQSLLKKKLVMELYDSLRYISEGQVLAFIGPTGCGKTGLATSYLVNAINKQYRGRFFDFKELIRLLNASTADYSEKRTFKQLAAIDCLLIDEVGYSILDRTQAGLFFDLIKMRHKKHCTIITSQLGFDDWDTFINDPHLRAAILDRVTENCTIFNMKKCISIRDKKVVYASENDKPE
jgi:DNA replication protein DnaC